VKRFLALVLFPLITTACAPSSTPVAPSTLISPTASLSITGVTASVEPAATGFLYHVAMHIAETSGKSGAKFGTLNVLFPDGRASVATVTLTTLAAGTAEDTGNIDVADPTGTAVEPKVVIALSFAEDSGRVSTATSASTPVTVLPAPTGSS